MSAAVRSDLIRTACLSLLLLAASFWSGFSGDNLSFVLLLGLGTMMLYSVLKLGLFPRPAIKRGALALALGITGVGGSLLGNRLGWAAFEHETRSRLPQYETVVRALRAQMATTSAPPRVVLQTPAAGIAWADMTREGAHLGVARLALSRSPRQLRLFYDASRSLPARDESERCLRRLASHWYWYRVC